MTMSLEHILEKIIADAKAEAADIEAKGDEEAQRILTAAEVEGNAIKARLLTKAKQDADERAARALTLARLEARNTRLAAKQAAIDESFEQALKRLADLPTGEYRAILLAQVMSSVNSGNEEIILSPADRDRAGHALVDEANAALAKAGKPANLRLASETRPIAGGVILRDGDVELNCTFETTLRLHRDELVPRVAEVLFGSDPDRS